MQTHNLFYQFSPSEKLLLKNLKGKMFCLLKIVPGRWTGVSVHKSGSHSAGLKCYMFFDFAGKNQETYKFEFQPLPWSIMGDIAKPVISKEAPDTTGQETLLGLTFGNQAITKIEIFGLKASGIRDGEIDEQYDGHPFNALIENMVAFSFGDRSVISVSFNRDPDESNNKVWVQYYGEAEDFYESINGSENIHGEKQHQLLETF